MTQYVRDEKSLLGNMTVHREDRQFLKARWDQELHNFERISINIFGKLLDRGDVSPLIKQHVARGITHASCYVAFCINAWSMDQSKSIRIGDSKREVLDRQLLLRKSWAWSSGEMSPLQGSLSILRQFWNQSFKTHPACPIYDTVNFRFCFENFMWARHLENRINEVDLPQLRALAHQPHQGAQFLATIVLQNPAAPRAPVVAEDAVVAEGIAVEPLTPVVVDDAVGAEGSDAAGVVGDAADGGIDGA